MKEKILTMRNGKAVWGPAPKDTDPVDPSRLPEGYPYKESKEITLLEETTIETADGGNGFGMTQTVPTLTVENGVTYTVVFDGTAYECVYSEASGYRYLGNISIVGMTPDTKEPFCMIFNNSNELFMFATATAEEHTISVSGLVNAINKMSDEYLEQPTMLVKIKSQIGADGSTVYSADVSQDEIRNAVNAGYAVMGYCYKDGFLTLQDLTNLNELYFSAVKYLSETSWLAVCYIITADGVTRKQASLTAS